MFDDFMAEFGGKIIRQLFSQRRTTGKGNGAPERVVRRPVIGG
jgi:hypothetical protein